VPLNGARSTPSWDESPALAQQAAGKDVVVHFAERHHLAAQRAEYFRLPSLFGLTAGCGASLTSLVPQERL
jgi:hypothetical protein